MTPKEPAEVDALLERLSREATASGYHLNADADFTRALVEGLVTNLKRYGYMSCPCRRAAGNREADLDIICPCDYRDADLGEYGVCYCCLYVSRDVAEGRREAAPIPERRPAKPQDRRQYRPKSASGDADVKLWRCRVCGYLCARAAPPETCPICRATKDRFEPFVLGPG